MAPSSCCYKREKLENATEEARLHAERWLIGFEGGYVELYKRAKALVPESVWQMYKNLEAKGTWEQGELSKAKRVMWTEWKKRPNLLRRFNVGTNRKAGKAGKGS